MYKKILRGIALLVAVLMIMSTSAFAMDMRASSRIGTSSVDAGSTMDDIGASEINIQRYNGVRWITETTLTPIDAPEMQDSNTTRHSASIPYTPEYSGYAYRAIVSVYAKDSSGTSTTSVTSAQILI